MAGRDWGMHEHEHKHPHEHEHGHEHQHEHALVRGAAEGKTLFFDAGAGISGDMTIAALLDLGVPMRVVEDAVGQLALEGYRLSRGHAHRSGIVASTFSVDVLGAQPERTWQSIDAMIAGAKLETRVKTLSRAVFRRLAEAEAEVHGATVESVHFHEVGAVDSIVDIVGACAMIAWLGPQQIVYSPLPMGYGTVKARHGILPLPAPATVLCLRGVPTYAIDIEGETVTPTGAALASSLATSFSRWPEMIPELVGWGAGSHEFAARPNLLRAVVGAHGALVDDAGGATHAVLEANVDDMTGELAGHVVARLMREGALDVSLLPTTTKKGRPGLLLSVISSESQREHVAKVILRETTTIGVRWHVVRRLERNRRMEKLPTRYGEVAMKVSGGQGVPEQAKPEFDDCVRLAEAAGVPVRDVIAAAVAAWSQRSDAGK